MVQSAQLFGSDRNLFSKYIFFPFLGLYLNHNNLFCILNFDSYFFHIFVAFIAISRVSFYDCSWKVCMTEVAALPIRLQRPTSYRNSESYNFHSFSPNSQYI